MAEICKNCANEIEINFCSNCGQKKAKRIDRTYIKDEIQYTFLHTNKGFFYSVKRLLRAPGKTTREFIEGNRVNHYKPILLLFVLAGITAFLTNTFFKPEEYFNGVYSYTKEMNQSQEFYLKISSFILKYYSLVMTAFVPPMALVSWLSFKKWGYNYFENIIICANFFSTYLILNAIIIFPVQILFKAISLDMMAPTTIGIFLMFGLFFWFYIDLYNKKPAGDVVLRIFLMLVLAFVGYVLTILLAIFVAVAYSLITGVDLREMFPAPK